MKQITLSASGSHPGVHVDLLKLIDTRLLVQANSGGGKSWLLRLLAERAGEHLQTIVLDNEGEFATLREKLDMVLVGSDGDLPANPRAATLLARRLLETQVSAVVDLYELKLQDRRSFVKLFLESLIHLPRGLWKPTLVLIDEAHLYCPERGAGDAESTDAVISLMAQGRKRGFCGVLATQRLSKLHKDAAAECNNVLIGRTSLDNDQLRAGDILGMSKADRLELRNLDAGEWYGFGPAFSERGVFRFKAGAVATTHPKPGERHTLSAPAPSAKVKSALAKLADLPQQAETEIRDLATAKRELADRDREIRQLKSGAPVVIAPAKEPKFDAAKLRAMAKKEGDRAVARVLRPHLVAMRRFLAAHDSTIEKMSKERQELAALVALAEEVEKAGVEVAEVQALRIVAPRPTPPARMEPRVRATPPTTVEGNGHVSAVEQKILNELAELEAMGIAQPDKAQLGLMCGYTNPRSGGFSEPLARLVSGGLVTYPRPGAVAITDAGRGTAAAVDSPRSTAELQRRILDKLDKPMAAILGALINVYPNAADKDALGRSLGYTNPRSGGFSEPMADLKTLGLITYPRRGEAAAAKALFLES